MAEGIGIVGNWRLNTHQLSSQIKQKRGNRTLVEVASEIGDISPATISRVENESVLDIKTLLKLCNWLEVPPYIFFYNSRDQQEREEDVEGNRMNEIIALIMSDLPNSRARDALVTFICLVYASKPVRVGR